MKWLRSLQIIGVWMWMQMIMWGIVHLHTWELVMWHTCHPSEAKWSKSTLPMTEGEWRLDTGTGKPVVFPKQVRQVWVLHWILTPCHTAYLCCGVAGINRFIVIFIISLSYPNDGTKYGNASHAFHFHHHNSMHIKSTYIANHYRYLESQIQR